MSTNQDTEPVVTFDWTESDSAGMAVVSAIAEEVSIDPIDLRPLYETIEPEALDSLLTSVSYSGSSPNGGIDFTYHNYRVLIKVNGRGYLYDEDATPESLLRLQTS